MSSSSTILSWKIPSHFWSDECLGFKFLALILEIRVMHFCGNPIHILGYTEFEKFSIVGEPIAETLQGDAMNTLSAQF